jgi:hypothetical protein
MIRALTILTLFAAAGVGCQKSASFSEDSAPYHALRVGHRSVALDSSAHHLSNGVRPEGVLPWYAGRNDRHPAVEAGYAGATFEASTTLTYDRQSHHNGRVRDHYHNTTYRTRTRSIIR